jgi:hypothetical protein
MACSLSELAVFNWLIHTEGLRDCESASRFLAPYNGWHEISQHLSAMTISQKFDCSTFKRTQSTTFQHIK